MAGIGFELKKLFSQKGIILNVRANLYASLVVTGPMVLGVLLLLGAKFISSTGGATPHQQDLIIVVITYSLLFSLLISSLLMYVLARYIADILYVEDYSRILPSMYGAISLLLVVGGIGWGIFLYLSKLPFSYGVLSFILFCEGIFVWIQVNYITAIKDYKKIFIGFIMGIFIGLMVGYLLVWAHFDVVASLLAGACFSYGIVIIMFSVVLHEYFPKGTGSSLRFFEWIEKYPSLTFVGFFTTLGLFIHLMLMWGSPWGVQVHGFFYHAPAHDIPALLAFITGLISTVNFVTSVEVNIYPRYSRYFNLLNGEGSLDDIEKANDEMLDVLKQELLYLSLRQIIVTILSIVVIGEILLYLNLGFTSVMIGLFRVLCIGYGLFAIGNTMMLFLLYFSQYRDAFLTAVAFLSFNTVGTLLTISLPEIYYGFGFVAAGFAMYLVSLVLLSQYTKRIDYHIFSTQPIFFIEKKGILTRLARSLDEQKFS